MLQTLAEKNDASKPSHSHKNQVLHGILPSSKVWKQLISLVYMSKQHGATTGINPVTCHWAPKTSGSETSALLRDLLDTPLGQPVGKKWVIRCKPSSAKRTLFWGFTHNTIQPLLTNHLISVGGWQQILITARQKSLTENQDPFSEAYHVNHVVKKNPSQRARVLFKCWYQERSKRCDSWDCLVFQHRRQRKTFGRGTNTFSFSFICC